MWRYRLNVGRRDTAFDCWQDDEAKWHQALGSGRNASFFND